MLWLILFFANAIDVAGTWYAFSLGYDELNPLIDYIHRRYGMSGVTLFKSIWLCAVFPMLHHLRGWIMSLFVLCCGVYSCLAVVHIANILMDVV